jgi:hypothetical protein
MNHSFFFTCISLWKVKALIPSANKVISNHIQVDFHMPVNMHLSDMLDSRLLPIVGFQASPCT